MSAASEVLLVANRGEIARRVIRTARALDIDTVAVFTDADASGPWIHEAGRAVRVSSYLAVPELLEAAARTGCTAVHPGYGFLSESPDFASAVQDFGLVWVGPPVEAMRLMALKVAAKQAAIAAGVPVLGDEGWPRLVKASAGGGGRGMRVVRSAQDLDEALAVGSREAAAAFGDGAVFTERFLENARHVEVQVLGDQHGTVLHLLDRDCSVQRRHQKVIEEAPAPRIDPAVSAAMREAAVHLAASIGYTGVGTVEFLLQGNEFFFLEMNTRLQVEHTVTEEVLGLDLVALQLLVAAGGALPFTQADVVARGHSVQARLCAEQPASGWLPSTGRILRWLPPAGVRVDSAVEARSVVGSAYDSLLAKVVVHAATRHEALARCAAAVGALEVTGVQTNRDLLGEVLRSSALRQMDVHTGWLESSGLVDIEVTHEVVELAGRCAMVACAARGRTGPVVPFAWRAVPGPAQVSHWSCGSLGVEARLPTVVHEASGTRVDIEAGGVRHIAEVDLDGDVAWVNVAGHVVRLERVRGSSASARAAGDLTAPLPGTVIRVAVVAGEQVEHDQTLVVVEAMKMEHVIRAHHSGEVEELLVVVGQSVDVGQVLVRLSTDESQGD